MGESSAVFVTFVTFASLVTLASGIVGEYGVLTRRRPHATPRRDKSGPYTPFMGESPTVFVTFASVVTAIRTVDL
jgi:hypothetical protein